jgi:hypothetical protein
MLASVFFFIYQNFHQGFFSGLGGFVEVLFCFAGFGCGLFDLFFN